MKKITYCITFVLCCILTIGVFGQSAETVNGANTTQPFFNLSRIIPNTGTYYPPSPAAPALIYDNGPILNVAPDRSRLQNITLGMTSLGAGAQFTANNRMADDVTLTDDYDITELHFYTYQTGSTTTSTITGITLRIWDGVPGLAGSNIVWGDATTNVLASSAWSTIYRDSESTPATNRPIMDCTINPTGLTLTAGTYWLDWNYSGSLSSGPWAPPIAILGQTTTGNGLQSLAGGPYNPLLDAGTSTQQGLPFQIIGSVVSTGGGGPVAECATVVPTPIPAVGTGGSACTNPTLSLATVSATGNVGTGAGDYNLDSIEIELTHTWASDLDIFLISPDGTITVELSTDNGGSTGLDTAATLVFTDSSVNAVTGWTGGAPMADYLAEGGLLNTLLAGQSITGDWTLRICDDSGGDSGTLLSYCINFSEVAIVVGNPPTIACPADIVINNAPGTCGAVANFAGVAIDDEDGNISSSIIATPASGSTFAVGVTTVELSVTDSDNNTVTCSFTVTVNDNELPIAVCQDITVDIDPITGMATIAAADVDNGSMDNCGSVTLALDITTFDCSMTGANTVVLTVTDNSGNIATCTSTVTVQDVTAPVITCIGGVATVSVLEEFEGATIPTGWSTNILVGTYDWTFGSGDMPVGGDFPTNAAIFDDDAAGNGDNVAELLSPIYDLSGTTTAELSFDYALQDFAGSGLLRAEVWDGAAWQQVFLADNADIDPVNTGVLDVLAFANAAFQVKFTWDDETGFNWGAGVDNVLLNYESAAGGGLDVFLDANGMASVDPNDLLLSVDEACGYTVTAGGAGGGTTGSLTTTFAGGNGLDGAMFDVTAINDLTIDSFDVNLPTGADNDFEIYYKTGTWVGSNTNPGDWTLLATLTGITSAGAGLPTALNLNLGIVVPAGDRAAFYVTTTDNGTLSYTNGTVTGNLFASDANLEFYEGRGVDYPFTGGFEPRVFNGNIHYTTGGGGGGLDFTCADLGPNQVEVTVTDASGNESTCIATVNVIDNIAPVITCGTNPTVSETEDFEGTTVPAGWSTEILAGVADWTFGSGAMPTGDDFTSNAAIFNDDAAGSGQTNKVSLSSPVYDLTDATNVLVGYDVAFQESGDQTFTVEVYDGTAWQQIALYDADLVPNIQTESIDASAFANAAFQVRWTFDDLGGWGWAAGVDNFDLSYELAGTGNVVEVELGPDGTTTIDPYSLLSDIVEACGISTIAVDVTTVSCADIGTPIMITVFVSDASGNIASCTAEVNVVDKLAPVITCPADQTVDPGAGGLFYILPDYFATGEATAVDNCTDPVTITSQSPAVGTPLPDGTHTITLTAEDEYGNVSTCSFVLTVETTIGVGENSLDKGLALYPNPASNVVNLVNKTNISLEKMMIYDINGKLVNTTDLRTMQGEKAVDVSSLASGVYVVQIIGNNASTVKRLIKE
ncbi:regulatory P domain of subtilisin-like proprotein convertases [Aequorivita sublithincola DSM 14238]|uniref:Regulatory P domain of subtilisin-like proprotein convertases n=1 Tax=Aequorivita sublithincola (strain DSM 14238 / LMG 21431 / ACAM 643 / 9-3) TaxID=746697 RepID=I3YX21_AEQSU|nr:HYR domain-containing protein [Aequorivita sublithincola]AFL81539.1 regulatory P domain of subtilisin-like proprotein convertases [Aequorivita sublithincola DSM 14238]